MNETNITRQLMISLGKLFPKMRIFRNNVGLGWAGQHKRIDGGVLVINAQPLHAGLTKGSSDLIGWHTVEITPEMVGKPVAIFTSIEVKTKRGAVRPEQIQWLDQVNKAGGIGILYRDGDNINELLKYKP